jgi:phosphoenolpyruvate carboxykinase (ATP)
MATVPAVDHIKDLNSLLSSANVYRNLSAACLVEESLRRGETRACANGAIVGETGKRTGRSPKDKFIVKDSATADKVNWGTVNQPFSSDQFDALYARVIDYLKGKDLFVQQLFAGADPRYRLPIQVVNEYAWHNLFVRQLFVRPSAQELKSHTPEFTVICAPEFQADPKRDGTNSDAFIITDFTRKIVLIGGTKYAGEQKKSIFGVMNFVRRRRRDRPVLRLEWYRQDDAFRGSEARTYWR